METVRFYRNPYLTHARKIQHSPFTLGSDFNKYFFSKLWNTIWPIVSYASLLVGFPLSTDSSSNINQLGEKARFSSVQNFIIVDWSLVNSYHFIQNFVKKIIAITSNSSSPASSSSSHKCQKHSSSSHI